MSRRNWNGALVLGSAMLLALLVILVLPVFVHLDSDTIHLTFTVDEKIVQPPLAPGQNGYLLGTDIAGRDLFARLILGARLTLLAAFGITLLRALFAIPLGLVAGWYGGFLAQVTNLFSSSLSALPTLLLVLFALKGLSVFITDTSQIPYFYIGVLVVAGFPRMAEQVRRLTEVVKPKPYIESAIAAGSGTGRILFRHILPVILGDMTVILAAEAAWVLMTMGQLAIFGVWLSTPIPIPREGFPTIWVEKTPEWGTMLALTRGMFKWKPWIPFYPALALGLTATALQLTAEGLRQRWLNRR